jgi:hypothetical protein
MANSNAIDDEWMEEVSTGKVDRINRDVEAEVFIERGEISDRFEEVIETIVDSGVILCSWTIERYQRVLVVSRLELFPRVG